MVPIYIVSAACAAVASGLATYLSYNASPYLAGFVAAFPIGMAMMITFPKDGDNEPYRAFSLGILAYAICATILYGLLQSGWDKDKAVVAAVIGWLLIAFVVWSVSR